MRPRPVPPVRRGTPPVLLPIARCPQAQKALQERKRGTEPQRPSVRMRQPRSRTRGLAGPQVLPALPLGAWPQRPCRHGGGIASRSGLGHRPGPLPFPALRESAAFRARRWAHGPWPLAHSCLSCIYVISSARSSHLPPPRSLPWHLPWALAQVLRSSCSETILPLYVSKIREPMKSANIGNGSLPQIPFHVTPPPRVSKRPRGENYCPPPTSTGAVRSCPWSMRSDISPPPPHTPTRLLHQAQGSQPQPGSGTRGRVGMVGPWLRVRICRPSLPSWMHWSASV